MKRQKRSDMTVEFAAARMDAVMQLGVPSQSSAVLTIDLDAIRANYLDLRARALPAACAAVVKANAYGLGVEQVAPVLQAAGCETFFVATLEEGVALRQILGRSNRIAVLNGLAPSSEDICLRANLTPIVNSLAQYRAYAGLARRVGAPLAVILQFDTGMARFGLGEEEAIALAAEAHNADLDADLLDVVLVMSHLACAPQPDNPANKAQLVAFERMSARFPGIPRSLAASSGIFLGEAFRLDMVRPGAALFGISPHPGHAMRPVIRLRGRVMQVRDVPVGTDVGYGHEWRAPRRTTLATIAAGYADGIPRSTSQRAMAWHGGQELPYVGRLSMDSLILDATGVDLHVGDLVDIIGPQYDVDAAAAAADTIGYEILTRLGHRFHRHYLKTEAAD